MNEELLGLLARLREPGDNPLTDAELTQLRTGIRERGGELADAERTPEVVTELQELATAAGEVATQVTERSDAAAARDADAQTALDAITQATADAPADGDGADGDGADGGDAAGAGDAADAAGDAGDGAAGDAAAPAAGDAAAPAGDAAAEPIAATGAPARPALGRVAAPARHAPRRTTPEPAVARATATLTAAGDLPGFSAGSEIRSMDDLAVAMAKKIRSIGPNGGSVLVASLTTEFPEERMLHESDQSGNERKYRDAIAPAALTASGGICAPVAVDYSIPTFATSERPVRDALVRFGAERGGITFTAPPKIGDVAGATGIWTEANDVSPSSPATKVKLQVSCGSPTTVLVDAITTILEFGNMQGRFQPESVAANTENAIAAAARVADDNLLAKIHGLSTEVTLTPSVGAGRGVLEVVDQILAAVRYRMRLSDAARYRAIFPRWLKDMIRADYAKELPSGTDRLGMTDAEIDAYFTVRGVNPSWHLDGLAAQGSGNTYPLQGFAAQSAGALAVWPTKVTFPIFPEGSFQFLDGGELNLGVVRDSTLNSTNDYETFTETFENVAFRGVESLQVIATLAPTGGSSGTVTPANP